MAAKAVWSLMNELEAAGRRWPPENWHCFDDDGGEEDDGDDDDGDCEAASATEAQQQGCDVSEMRAVVI